MKRVISLYAAALVCFLAAPALQAAATEQQPAAAEPNAQPAAQDKNVVDAEFVSQYATVPSKDEVLIIDSRPARKYDQGHIVPAINISDSQFDKLTHLLPEDKSTLLIFYCGGLKCNLSTKSAAKAEALGYTNVKVYAEGWPDWKAKGHIPGVSAAYVKKLVDKPGEAVIVDARPARKFAKDHVPGAINISDREFDDKLNLLPSDKSTEIIYYCGGYDCPLSSKSAAKAVAQGDTKVKLFQSGYPAWNEAYGGSDALTALYYHAKERDSARFAVDSDGSSGPVRETADLWFHTLVMLAARGLGPDAVLAELEARHFERLGRDYLDMAARHRVEGTPRFIDKMPNNFPNIGLLHLILPRAKIIDARRHPLDACLGNFRQLYAKGQNFSYDLQEIGEPNLDQILDSFIVKQGLNREVEMAG